MIHPKMRFTYVGVDSHKDTHTAVFLNCFYEKLGELTFSTTPSDFPRFLEDAGKLLYEGTQFAFGFEDISAYGRSLVKFLVNQGLMVKHVNAALVATERSSDNVLMKTDSIDAECVARVLLNRFDKLPLAVPSDKLFTLKSLVARRESTNKIKAMLKNHLHTLIYENYPNYNSFWNDVSCQSALAFYEAYPSPSCLMESSLEELTALLQDASKGLVGKPKALHIWQTVERNEVPPCEHEAIRNITIRSTVTQLKMAVEGMDAIENELEYFLNLFDYPLTSMKGIDTVTAAKLIAEIGDINRFSSPAKLASYAGVAPVTYASGLTNIQYANKRGNRTLNEIFFRLAMGFIVLRGNQKVAVNPFFYEYYHKKLAEGKTKKQALKCVQRRLVTIIYNMMKHNEDYINPPVSFPERDKLLESKKHQASFH